MNGVTFFVTFVGFVFGLVFDRLLEGPGGHSRSNVGFMNFRLISISLDPPKLRLSIGIYNTCGLSPFFHASHAGSHGAT